MLLHAGDYCAPFSLQPFEEAQHVAGRRVRQERRRHAGTAREGARRASAPSCSRRRTASSSAAQRILRRPRHRRRAAAQHRGAQHRRARLHAPAGDEDARRHADRESGRGVRLALRHAEGRDPRSRHEDRWSSSVSTPRTGRHDGCAAGSSSSTTARSSRSSSRAGCARRASTRRFIRRRAASSGFATGSRPASSSAADRTPSTTTDAPTADPAMLDVAPVLGVCYGMQLIAHLLGRRGDARRPARVRPRRDHGRRVASALFDGIRSERDARRCG